MIRMSYVVECPIVFFSFVTLVGRKQCQNVWKMLNFNIFRRLRHFRQVLRQVKAWVILELQDIIRVLHVDACPIVLFCFMSNVGWVKSVKHYEKLSFRSVFNRLSPFPQDFGVSYVRTAQNKIIATCSGVPNCFYFV